MGNLMIQAVLIQINNKIYFISKLQKDNTFIHQWKNQKLYSFLNVII